MRDWNPITTLVLGVLTSGLCAQTSFEEKTTDASNMRLNVTNLGTFGNAWRGYRDGSGDPSCEYPAGSGIEHLFEGGLWIGGLENGGNIRVSTSAYDNSQGYAPGRAGFEFTAAPGSGLTERSTLKDSRFFSLNAVSHQDYVAEFTDENTVIPGTGIPISSHTNPMQVDFRMETYNWNYSFSDFMVIVNLRIVNAGPNFFDDLYVGLWNNTVVRNVNITPAGAGGAVFYSQGGNGFLDSLNLAYCYDASGDVGFTESYIGQRFLGAQDKYGFHHPQIDSAFNTLSQQLELDTNFKCHYNAWQFNNSSATYAFPSNDNQRYLKMSQGLNHDLCWSQPGLPQCVGKDIQADMNASGNRSDLVSVGPFQRFEPGDVIEIAFAYVIGKKNEDGNPNSDNNEIQRVNLVNNANWAQTAYNGEDANFNGRLDPGEDRDGNGVITRFILPSPPDIPRTRVVASDHRIELYWDDRSERSVDPITKELDFEGYRVYLSRLGFDVTGTNDLASNFVKAGEYDLAGNGLFYETGLDPIRLNEPVYFEGDTTAYRYRFAFENVQNGWQQAVAVTAFDRGNPASGLESLESSFLANDFRAFAGTAPNANLEENPPYVYPNPYYYGASWEGKSNFQEESRKLIFANLPARCRITVFSSSGDLIDRFEHNEAYYGSDIRWFGTFGSENPEENVFSGGEHAWDLLSRDTQILARGLYLFTVEDLDTGDSKTGQFLIIR
ncbi:hypothetical protein GC167_00080 [bacterium]|nr:hypothetical protein [bacterium]